MNENVNVIEVPEDAIDGFLDVRETGETNMFDVNTVWRLMSDRGYYEGCSWLIGGTGKSRVDSERYSALISAVEKRLLKQRG